MEKNMRVIETQAELDRLPVEASVWGTSHRYIEAPGSGSPYSKLEDGMWWDYGNDFAVGSDDIMLPAVLVWGGVPETRNDPAPRTSAKISIRNCPACADGRLCVQWSGVACDKCGYTFCY